MNIESRTNKKSYRFFEWLFTLVVINIITIILTIPVITMLPAHVGAYATIKDVKENGPQRIIRRYFKNMWKYIEKSFLIGIIFTVIIVIAIFSINFYRNHFDSSNILGQAGYWVMLLILLVVVILLLHVPLIIINFNSFNVFDTIKMSMFICFKFILSTLIILVCDIVMIVGVLALPIWVFIGFSLPIFLIMKFTEPSYNYLKKIDIENIIKKAKEIENEEDDFGD